MKGYSVYGKLLAAPGKAGELRECLLEAAEAMENVRDCHTYLIGSRPEEPDAVYVFELWKDQAAHEASLQLPVFRELIGKARPLITGMEDYPPVQFQGGKY